MSEVRRLPGEPEKVFGIDAEYLSGRRFPYQEDASLVEDVDLIAATPGEDINWREDEIARKVLIKHLQSGNSYGILLKERHCKFLQPELGPWVENSKTVGTDWKPAVLEGWEPPEH
jgi:hypothetical protein